ncbi:MAG: four helix bundle protein [Bacteroidota bacterium]
MGRAGKRTIPEAYRKRQYPKHFVSKLSDADAECSETQVWIDFAIQCKYLDEEKGRKLKKDYQTIGKVLGSIIRKPDNFIID